MNDTLVWTVSVRPEVFAAAAAAVLPVRYDSDPIFDPIPETVPAGASRMGRLVPLDAQWADRTGDEIDLYRLGDATVVVAAASTTAYGPALSGLVGALINVSLWPFERCATRIGRDAVTLTYRNLMGDKEIDVLIYPDGRIVAEVNGVRGPDCRDKLDALLAGLGKVVDERETPDYALPPTEASHDVSVKAG